MTKVSTRNVNSKIVKYAMSTVLAGSLVVTSASMASASSSAADSSTASAGQVSAATDTLYLSESDLAGLGLTKADAEQLTADFTAAVNQAEKSGDIKHEEAEALRKSLATPPSAPNDEMAHAAALPVWAAAAIVGCAGSVVLGQGKTQITNALQQGASVDSATDIAIGAGVDCVFGAVPGGAIGAAAKKSLTKPIKDALRPHVKKIVQKMKNEQEGQHG